MSNVLAKLSSVLDIKRNVVGVHFIYDQQTFEESEAVLLKRPITYCVMVKSASKGARIKATLEQFGCGGGSRALGLNEPSAEYQSGQEYRNFGLYRDSAIAKNVVNNMTFIKHRLYGVVIQPLEFFVEKPDVVLIITNSFNSMRIIQGYTYQFGTQVNFKMTGNQAVCSECTAYPYETNSINISMFCCGTRYLAAWSMDEVAIGMPYEIFVQTVEGVYQTANGAETNDRKAVIRENLKNNNVGDPGIIDDQAYFIVLKNEEN
jgi:uncharacterized protein (DUF169 family)